jgi:ferredoxin
MNKKITHVRVMPGCVSCGACAVICPEVFELRGVSCVKQGASFDKNAAAIREAAQNCPVSVIEVVETE